MTEQVPSKEQMISLDEVIKLYDRIQHVYDDALVPVEAGVVKRLCAELCDQRMLSTAHEPPAECAGCEEFVRMQHDIASILGVDADTDSIGLHGLIYEALSTRAAQPPATAQMTLARANEIAEDIAEAMRITSKGEWVIDLVGGPFTADQLEAIAVIMRNEASETKGAAP